MIDQRETFFVLEPTVDDLPPNGRTAAYLLVTVTCTLLNRDRGLSLSMSSNGIFRLAIYVCICNDGTFQCKMSFSYRFHLPFQMIVSGFWAIFWGRGIGAAVSVED